MFTLKKQGHSQSTTSTTMQKEENSTNLEIVMEFFNKERCHNGVIVGFLHDSFQMSDKKTSYTLS